MAKYRKKPIVVDAIKYDKEHGEFYPVGGENKMINTSKLRAYKIDISEDDLNDCFKYMDDDFLVGIKGQELVVRYNERVYRGSYEEIKEAFGEELFETWIEKAESNKGNHPFYFRCLVCGKMIFNKEAIYCDECREEARVLDKEKLENADIDSYGRLAAAIIQEEMDVYDADLKKMLSAAIDFKNAQRVVINAAEKFKEAFNKVAACERYIHSADFDILTHGVNPKLVVDYKRDEALKSANGEA